MPLNIDSVFNPPPLFDLNPAAPANATPANAAPEGTLQIGPQAMASAPAVSPTPLKGVSEMPPIPKAGVELVKLVLLIAGCSIGVLISYLVWMDYTIGRDVHQAYQEVLNPNRIGSEFYALGRLESFSLGLTAASKDNSAQLSKESAENADLTLKMIEALPSVTTGQKTELRKCVPLPTTTTRNEVINRCVQILEDVRQAALEAAAGVTNAQVAGDAAAKTNDSRQTLHTFWIQAAQLILLNMLLPLLTALLGYIFGTQSHSPAQ
jgi:hypothetical protein